MSRKEQDANLLINTKDDLLLKAQNVYELNKEDLVLFDRYVQLLIKNNELAQAETLIMNSPLLKKENCVESGLVHAHLFYKMKKYDLADEMFDALILDFPEHIKVRMVYAQTLRKRKKLIKAHEIIKGVNVELLDKKQRLLYEEIVNIFTTVAQKEGRLLDESDDFGILSMKHAILHFKDSHDPRTSTNQLGKVSLITGTLGPGGAERQLCITAINMNEKKQRGELVSGIHINHEVDVLINIFDSDAEKGFFLPLLKKNKVNLFQVKDMPLTPIEQLDLSYPTLLHLLEESPSSIRYGIHRLVQYFRETKTEVVFAWQDGAILFSAIAALVAEVPKIVFNFRGYPPNLRPHISKPEYYLFYKSLAEIPKVTFVTNTKITAKAYADWLNISPQRFTLIYNGIVPPVTEPEAGDEVMWNDFASKTADATETIGGVFRFETDKRPVLVIRFIKRYLQKHPQARFVLVGEGRLRKQCMDLAEELKISQRILFVGLSKTVGYWMLKMDAMVLMSLYEGLPNVLIEAQYLGVPVVSTPAGGAEECFIEGETGFILSDAQEPDLYEACDKVATLIEQFKNNVALKNKTIHFANTNFSIAGMVENTVTTLARRTFQQEQSVCKELV